MFEELKQLGYQEQTHLDYNTLIADSMNLIIELAFVAKWFRDKHNLWLTIVKENKTNWKVILWEDVYIETVRERYPTYEEANLNGIKKLIEILKTKKQ